MSKIAKLSHLESCWFCEHGKSTQVFTVWIRQKSWTFLSI